MAAPSSDSQPHHTHSWHLLPPSSSLLSLRPHALPPPRTHNVHPPPTVPNSLSGRCLHRCCFTFPVINIHLKNNRGACYGKITSQRGGERERGECGVWRRRGVALCEWHLANCRMRRGKLEFSKLCAR